MVLVLLVCQSLFTAVKPALAAWDRDTNNLRHDGGVCRKSPALPRLLQHRDDSSRGGVFRIECAVASERRWPENRSNGGGNNYGNIRTIQDKSSTSSNSQPTATAAAKGFRPTTMRLKRQSATATATATVTVTVTVTATTTVPLPLSVASH